MKIIQQDFKVSSKAFFTFFLLTTITFFYFVFTEDYNNSSRLLFNLIGCLFFLPVCLYTLYVFSQLYEFTSAEIIIKPLFGLLRQKHFPLNKIKNVEFLINNNTNIVDNINIYFSDKNCIKKLSIGSLQVNMEKIKLFLYTHIDNLEEIQITRKTVFKDYFK